MRIGPLFAGVFCLSFQPVSAAGGPTFATLVARAYACDTLMSYAAVRYDESKVATPNAGDRDTKLFALRPPYYTRTTGYVNGYPMVNAGFDGRYWLGFSGKSSSLPPNTKDGHSEPWYPACVANGEHVFGGVRRRTLDGSPYDVFETSDDNGDPLLYAFDPKTHLLAFSKLLRSFGSILYVDYR